MNGQEDEVLAKARQLRAAGVPLEEIERYVASKRGGGSRTPLSAALRRHDAPAVEKIVGRQNLSEQEQTEAESPTYRERLGGNLVNLVRDVPGVEALTTGAHALLKRQPYSKSFKDVHGTADQAPGKVKWPSRIAGGAVAGAMLPGSLLVQGALYGALSGAAQADPDANLEDRIIDTALGGTVGALASKVPGVVRGTLNNAAIVRDLTLAPFMSGARRRLAGRIAGAIGDAEKPAVVPKSVATVVKQPAPQRLVPEPSAPPTFTKDEVVERLVKMGVPRGKAAQAAAPTVERSALSTESAREKAIREGEEAFRQALEEGGAANWTPEAMAARKGVPLDPDPATNWGLMERIEAALLEGKPGRRIVPAMRPPKSP